MNRLTLTLAFVLAVCVSANGQDFRVQYLEGLVEVQKGAAWQEVAAGDAVAAAAVLRLDDGAFVELTGGGSVMRFSRRGTYDLARLASASAQNRAVGVGTFLTQRAKAMAGPAARKEGAAVAGVRGAASGPGQPQWVGGESAEELLSRGIEKLSGGAYKEAYALFDEAREASTGPDEARAAFYLGYAAYLGGDVAGALRLLEKPKPNPASGHYADHVLVLAQVLVETFAYADAADLLQGYLRSGAPAAENMQTANLLLGLSYKGLGDRERAAGSLRAAQQANAGSDAGRAAARLLETL